MERAFGELTEAEVKCITHENKCPLCGSEGFYHGPEGSGMVNIMCDCGAVFNVPNVWEGMPPFLVGEYLRDEEARSSEAYASRKTFSLEVAKEKSGVWGIISKWLK